MIEPLGLTMIGICADTVFKLHGFKRAFYISMSFILGEKIGMSRMFREDGAVVPVTLIQAGPIVVTDIRTKARDGYEAVQVGYKHEKHPTKPMAGHLKDIPAKKIIREFPLPNAEMKRGDTMDVSVFQIGEKVKVSAITKGRGFQGAVKRHGFAGMPASHGHHHVLRHVGSIGQRFPQHTLKGTRMAGRMGGERMTVRGLTVMAIDLDRNTIAVKGAIPGRKGTILEIMSL